MHPCARAAVPPVLTFRQALGEVLLPHLPAVVDELFKIRLLKHADLLGKRQLLRRVVVDEKGQGVGGKSLEEVAEQDGVLVSQLVRVLQAQKGVHGLVAGTLHAAEIGV